MQMRYGVQIKFNLPFNCDTILRIYDCVMEGIEQSFEIASKNSWPSESLRNRESRNRIRLIKKVEENLVAQLTPDPPKVSVATMRTLFSPCSPHDLYTYFRSSDVTSEYIVSSVVYGKVVNAADYPEEYSTFQFPDVDHFPHGMKVLPLMLESEEQTSEFDRLISVMRPSDFPYGRDSFFPRWNAPALAFVWSRLRRVTPVVSWEYFDPATSEWELRPESSSK